MGGFINYFSEVEDFKVTINDAIWYASGIVLSTAFMLATLHPFRMYMTKVSCKVRVGCSGLIYRKTLRLTQADAGESGRIINLLSNDIVKFVRALASIQDVLNGPMEAIAFSIVIYMEIGVAGIVGLMLLISFVPLQGNFHFRILVNFHK